MQARSPPQRRERQKELDDVVCNLCKKSTPEEDFLLCDGCTRGEHASCCQVVDPPRFYFCTRCQSNGDTIKGMIIQELVAAEPHVLTWNEIGSRVADRRLHLQGDVDVTKKSVSAELTRMSNGETGLTDDQQPLLQRYIDESGLLVYYLTPAPKDNLPASDQPPWPSAAAVPEQFLSNMTIADQAHQTLPASGQRLAVLDMPNADMPGADMPGADMPGADMPDEDAPGRSPSPRLADSQPRTNPTRHRTASQTRDKPHAHAAQRGHTAWQQRRPRKPDPSYPDYAAGNGLSPVHRSASSPEGDDIALMQSPIRLVQPAPVQTPAQNSKSLRSQMRKLLSAPSPGEADPPAQTQNDVSEGLQSRLGAAMLQAARTAQAQSTQEIPHHASAVPPASLAAHAQSTQGALDHAPAVPLTSLAAHAQVTGGLSAAADVPCVGLASHTRSQNGAEDRSLQSPALAASPQQAHDTVHKSSTERPFYTFSEILRQSSEAPSNDDHGGDVMLEEADVACPSIMPRDDSGPRNSGGVVPHPQTITDSEDNNMMHQQDPPADDFPRSTSLLAEAIADQQGSQTLPAEAQQSPLTHINTASQVTSPHSGLCNQVLLPLQTISQGHTAQQHTAILPLSTVTHMGNVQPPPKLEAIAQQPVADQPVEPVAIVQGDVGAEGIPPPPLLLQSGYTGSQPITQASDSLHDSGSDVGAVADVPPLSASVQTDSAPQSPRQEDSASHATGQAASYATGQAASHAAGQAASGPHHSAVAQHAVVLSQADIMQQVAQWTDNRLCTVVHSNGMLQIQQVPGNEAADSAAGAEDGGQTPREHESADICATASKLVHRIVMGVQAVQAPHGQVVTQRKRKRDADTSASSKRRRLCKRLHSSLKTISCVMIALWLYPYVSGS